MKKLVLIFIIATIVVACKKKKDDTEPVPNPPVVVNPPVTNPTNNTTLFIDTATSNDVAISRQNGTIQNFQYNQGFSLVVVEREGTDSVFVGAIYAGGQNFEWDTLMFKGDSIMFVGNLDSTVAFPGPPVEYTASRYTIKRSVSGYPADLYKMIGFQGVYGSVSTQQYILNLREQPKVYKEFKEWLTPADLITFGKYFE